MLWIVRGLPGSGKSTFAKQLLENNSNTSHYEADMYFIDSKGFYVYNPSLIKAAHNWCQTKTEEDLRIGKSVVVSNTFTTLKEIKPYEDIAKKLNIKFEIYQANNSFKNIHNVPEEVLQRMKDRWQEYPGAIQIPPVNS